MSLPSGNPPRLLDQVREVIRMRHYSIRTEQAYVQWIRRFVLFHGKRQPREMGTRELTAFLSDLAVTHDVAASTQNQALHAIHFLNRDVLKVDLPWLDEVQGPRSRSTYRSCSREKKSRPEPGWARSGQPC